jgi:hypothetical protein
MGFKRAEFGISSSVSSAEVAGDVIKKLPHEDERWWSELTPAKFACAIGASCPAIFMSSAVSYSIIGTTLRPEEAPRLSGRVAPNESAIGISKELVDDAVVASILASGPISHLATLMARCCFAICRRLVQAVFSRAGYLPGAIALAVRRS